MFKRFNFILPVILTAFFISGTAYSLSVKSLNLKQLTALSSRIVRVTLEDKRVEQDEESGRLVTYYTFDVDDWLKGDESEKLTIKQLSPVEIEEGDVRITVNKSLGLQGYEKVKTYLLFLTADSERTGLTSPVGVHQGRFEMVRENSQWVIPSLKHRASLFKDLQKQLPGKALTKSQLGLGAASNDYETFKSVVLSLVESD